LPSSDRVFLNAAGQIGAAEFLSVLLAVALLLLGGGLVVA
jgi:hypothetical protein